MSTKTTNHTAIATKPQTPKATTEPFKYQTNALNSLITQNIKIISGAKINPIRPMDVNKWDYFMLSNFLPQ